MVPLPDLRTVVIISRPQFKLFRTIRNVQDFFYDGFEINSTTDILLHLKGGNIFCISYGFFFSLFFSGQLCYF